MVKHIQIGDISPRIQYTGDGVQTVFTYPFPVFADADIEVYEDTTLKNLTTDYMVSGAGNSSGGTVTFTAAPTSGSVVTIRRNIAIQRTSDFQVAGDFQAKVINDELDYQTAALQQVETDIARALRLGPTDSGVTILPDKATRASKYLGFDANGDPVATNAVGATGPQGPAGNMSGANNLLELTSPPTARTNLGLGGAAVENVAAGGVGDLLRADGDGSGLSGIVSGATVAEKSNIMLNAFRIEVNSGLAVQNMVDGVADVFTDQTGINTVSSTNETYDAINHLYNNGGISLSGTKTTITSSMISQVSITSFNAAQMVDGITNVNNAGYVAINTAAGAAIIINFGSAVVFGKWRQYVATAAASNGLWRVEYSDNGTTWTATDSVSSDLAAGAWHDFTWANVGAHQYWRLVTTATASGQGWLVELELYTFLPVLDMTLVSNAYTALSTPTSAFIVIEEEDVDAVTPNTDLKAYASRDGGTTWTQITLAVGTSLTTGRILTGTADISAQPAGTSMKYKIETLNTRRLKIHSIALQWS